MASIITDIAAEAWQMWVEVAPFLTLGLVVAGLMQPVFSMSVIQRWLGGRGFASCLKASLLGTPLPLCSCSVLPAAMQLHRSGASRGATVSFLIATPENGADSLMLSWGLLGPWMTLLRLFGAMASSLAAGSLTNLLEARDQKAGHVTTETDVRLVAMPSSTSLLPVLTEIPRDLGPNQGRSHTSSSPACCGSASGATVAPGWISRLLSCLADAFTRLLNDISVWLIVGVLTAATIARLVPPNAMAAWGTGPLTLVAVLLVSIPTYVCATASTPVAASLLAAGMSPGAVIVFLLAGPATNLSSAAIVRKELGSRALAGYLFGVVAVTLLLGLAVDQLMPATLFSFEHSQHDHGNHLTAPLAQLLAVLLAARIVWLRGHRLWKR